MRTTDVKDMKVTDGWKEGGKDEGSKEGWEGVWNEGSKEGKNEMRLARDERIHGVGS